jgi:arginine N-succinyltransferase
MVFIRPVSMKDLDALVELAARAGAGLTTLPKDRDLLHRRISKSEHSMADIPDRPGGESYLFVMEDALTHRVVGASGVVAKVGGFEPFYAYRIQTKIHKSAALKVRKEIPVLHLIGEHNGPAEIGSLFLDEEYRRKDNGRLLQLVRFLFIAEHIEAFEPIVVSELRGLIGPDGRSEFWEAVGRHFFDIDFAQADYLSVVSKKFIAELMPRHPIYIPLLPKAAQDVIGKVHESSKPAFKNLEGEGFTFSGMVDIFDAGPCVRCRRDDIRCVRESRVGRVEIISSSPLASPPYLVCTQKGEFRACTGKVQIVDLDRVQVEADCAKVLKLSVGQTIRYAALRPASAQ